MANMINHIFLTITYFLGNFWSKKTIFGAKNSENVRKKWFSALRKSKKKFFFQTICDSLGMFNESIFTFNLVSSPKIA